jgi:hypothetical protein
VSGSSDRILQLLQQISVLKELDNQYRAGPKTDLAKEDSRRRRSKRQQIGNEIKRLASSTRKQNSNER